MSESDLEEWQELSYFVRRSSTIKALNKKGIKYFFPIQYETFDRIKFGGDSIGREKTGAGKTLAYTLPVMERLRDQSILGKPQAEPKFLIILPTRQLAIQVSREIQSLKCDPQECRIVSIYGGNPINGQIYELRQGADIVAATPGRLLDFLQRKEISLRHLQTVCLDQADQMLKQGFQEAVEEIFTFIGRHTQMKTQKLLFSATIPPWVQELARKYLHPSFTMVNLLKNEEITIPTTIQHFCTCFRRDARTLNKKITTFIDTYAGSSGSVIVFCETRRQTSDLFYHLSTHQAKGILHGQISQDSRQQTFRKFREGKIQCLVATNVAARGLDIPSVDLVIQVEPPKRPEDYVHRAGRTGRAGKNGICVIFFEEYEQYLLKAIEKTAGIEFRNIQ